MIPNKNGRIYPKELFEKYLDEYNRTIFKQLIKSERKTKLKKIENVQFRND